MAVAWRLRCRLTATPPRGTSCSNIRQAPSDLRFLERWIGKVGGPAISCGQVVGQVGANRPPVRTPIAGLYVGGCGAGGRGVGTELAAASGELAADAALADLRHGMLGPRAAA